MALAAIGLGLAAANALFGGGSKARKSGAFSGIKQLGPEFSQFLLERLRTPAGETEQFRLGSQAIREALGGQSAAARQRLGESATAEGFLDSGAVMSGVQDIDRAEFQAFGGALRDLILGLEDRRTEGILPFLQGGAQESLGVQQANIQARGDTLGFLGNIATSLIGACWVARAIYGEDDPRWLDARRYVLTLAPASFRNWYLAHGEAFAERVRRSPALRMALRPLFDRMAAIGGKIRG